MGGQLVIPVEEDDDTPVVLFKAVLSTYEGLGAIYVPPVLNKYILITDTGLDIVCRPQGELCACYHNVFRWATLKPKCRTLISSAAGWLKRRP